MGKKLLFVVAGLACILLLMMGFMSKHNSSAAAAPLAPPSNPHYHIATFAGGCFWCMEPPFDKVDGVVETIAGYTGGWVKNPTYQQVSRGFTGHAESVRVVFDSRKVTYEKLLDVYWHQINPTTLNRQFVDVGSQYRTAIFYHNEAQKQAALKSKAALEKANRFKAPIVTEIVPAGDFWPAEDYHQNYYLKHPHKYKFYRWNSGRDQYIKSIWGKSEH